MENPFLTERPVRPTFLTVLCILTFIGSGSAVLSNASGLLFFTPEKGVAEIQAITSMASEGAEASLFMSFMNSSIEVIQTQIMHSTAIYSWLTLFSLISLVGAIMMFKLKRVGFFLYVFAQLAQLFVLPAYSGWNSVVVASMFMSGFFTLLFIVLYGMNYGKLRA